jgi:peptidoglycan biosynthesis protein MviN/MurJ (putative lipid II flippase)
VILLNPLGVKGLALAVSISSIIQFVLLINPYRKVLIDLRSFFLRIILVSIVAIIPVVYMQNLCGYVLSLLLGGLIFALIFICMGYILKIEEVCRLLKILKNQ